jgi:hypothetical protein
MIVCALRVAVWVCVAWVWGGWVGGWGVLMVVHVSNNHLLLP